MFVTSMVNTGQAFLGFMLGLGLFAGPLFAADEAAAIPWLEANLAPNPDFEEVAEDGRAPKDWTAQITPDSGATGETDPAVFLKGNRSLKIDVPKSGAQVTASSSPIPIEGGTTYLFSIALRGVPTYPWIQWLDENQKSVGNCNFHCPSAPSWDLRDAFKQAPANARFAQIGFTVGNDGQKPNGKNEPVTLWIDAVQFRKYLPPPTPDWAKGETVRVVAGGKTDTRVASYFVGIDDTFQERRGGSWSQIVNDPEAERGTALQARTEAKQGYMALTGHFPALPAGLYRARARVKIPPVKEIGAVGELVIGSQHTYIRQELPFVPSPEREDKYTHFETDFIIWDSGYWSLGLITYGKVAFSVDSLKVFCLAELQDRQLLTVYPGSEGALPADLKPARFDAVGNDPRHPLKGLVVAGLGYDRFKIAEVFHVLRLNTETKVVWVKTDSGATTFSGFPEDPRDFFQYSIIYLCNVNMRALALKDKNAIREYVKRGGALVVMGGQQSYERGGWRGSLIEETLPVEAAPQLRGGLTCAPKGQALKINRKIPWLEAISTASSPLVYYLHAVAVKPSGQVLVEAGDKPFLVTGAYGEGRVVCILGIPWGDTGPQATPFWEWNDWVDLLREVCWWAMKNSTDLTMENSEAQAIAGGTRS
ncbi:MAG: hypothetical protein HY360_02640 [Verrucomicrobia bacterium]|nr:hypothetical protein [Verrucomicrobiota bacterium]